MDENHFDEEARSEYDKIDSNKQPNDGSVGVEEEWNGISSSNINKKIKSITRKIHNNPKEEIIQEKNDATISSDNAQKTSQRLSEMKINKHSEKNGNFASTEMNAHGEVISIRKPKFKTLKSSHFAKNKNERYRKHRTSKITKSRDVNKKNLYKLDIMESIVLLVPLRRNNSSRLKSNDKKSVHTVPPRIQLYKENNKCPIENMCVRKHRQKRTKIVNKLISRNVNKANVRRRLLGAPTSNTVISYLLLSLYFFTSRGVVTFNRDACNQPLGMEDGRIPDDYITASSSYEYKSVGPQNGRLNKEYNGGAWCAKAQISGDKDREYLEIRLPGGNHIITGAATQGRFGNGQGAEYVESYFLEYKRDDMEHWRTYVDATGHKELVGNRNTYLVAPVNLHLPFIGSRIRFIPYSKHLRTVCMRVELYGCSARQGIVSYWGDQGHVYESRDLRVDLRDLSYDGKIANGTMSGGLGQLTDTFFGNDNMELKSSDKRGGTRWVGWNRTILNRPVILYFGFDDRKEFIDVNIQANNQKWREIECYKKVEIYVSDEPNVFGEPLIADTALFDENDVSAKNMSTPMMHAVGQFVKIVLHFTREWILVSEIQFDWVVPDTKLPPGNVKPSQPKQNNEAKQIKEIKDGSPVKESTSDTESEYGTEYNIETTESTAAVDNTSVPSFSTTSTNTPMPESIIDNVIFKVAVCVTLIVVTFLLLGMAYLFCENKSRIRFLNKSKDLKNIRQSQLPSQAKMTDMVRAPTPPELDDLYSEPFRLSSNRRNSNNRTVDSYSTNSLYSCDFTSFHGSRGRVSHQKPGMPYTISYSNPTNEITSNISYGHIPDENYYAASNIVQDTNKHWNIPRITTVQILPVRQDLCVSEEIEEVSSEPKKDVIVNQDDKMPPDCLEELCIAGYLTTMKFPPSQPPPGSKHVKTICNENVNKISNMGFHKMGPVYLCTLKDEVKGNSLILVKNVWLGSSRRKRREFVNEATWLCALRDTNVINAIGMNEEIPASVFFPYSKLGDLPEYLRQRSKTMNCEIPDYGEIVIYLRQIASGMKYLESMNIVHRDLAARNCIIWDNMVIKISNHANYCSKYKQDYYVHEAKQRLPIRWLSWEALLMVIAYTLKMLLFIQFLMNAFVLRGKWTFQSDIWAFGVTMWEISMMCNRQPFDELTNNDIYENAMRWKNSSPSRRIPSPPMSLPKELKIIFNSCFQKVPQDRPTFVEILHMLMTVNTNDLNMTYCF